MKKLIPWLIGAVVTLFFLMVVMSARAAEPASGEKVPLFITVQKHFQGVREEVRFEVKSIDGLIAICERELVESPEGTHLAFEFKKGEVPFEKSWQEKFIKAVSQTKKLRMLQILSGDRVNIAIKKF